MGKWLAWDGRRWKRDELGLAIRAAKEVVAELYREASQLLAISAAEFVEPDGTGSDPDERKSSIATAMADHAKRSSKNAAIRAMLSLAQSEEPIAAAADQFDRDQFALNVLNGTLDLRTGQLRPHRQSDLITKLAPVVYAPQALCPMWDRFVERVLPDADVRRFVQRFIGYCLTGDVSEQVLAFVYGLGANGKSVLLDVMLGLLGDYGCRAAPDLVLAKQGESHPTEIADLDGRRLVVCSEIEQGRAWAESTIKRITGDTTIKARLVKKDFYEFQATHKLVIAANTRPTVRGTDEGIWRRMRLVPFDVTIPPGERDRGLVARLIASEGSGILVWAVAGCLAWQRDSLGVPAAVNKATAEYREEQDVLGLWIAEDCIIGPGLFTPTAALHAAFTTWCHRTERPPWTQQTMRARLIERSGITPNRTNAARGLDGIGLIRRHADDGGRV